jgi:hypothetical protein
MLKLQDMLRSGFCAGVATATIVAGMLAGAVSPGGAQGGPLVGRVKIASNYVRADGCHDTTQVFTTQVPAVDRLDRSYRGELAGIEVVETAANNGHAHRNFTWVNNGSAISYELYAKGAGHWVDPPKVFGVNVGGGACLGAAGGSEGVDIYAHYRAE